MDAMDMPGANNQYQPAQQPARQSGRPTIGSLLDSSWGMFKRNAGVIIGWELISMLIMTVVMTAISVPYTMMVMNEVQSSTDPMAVDTTAAMPLGMSIGISIGTAVLMALLMPLAVNALTKSMQGMIGFGEVLKFKKGAFLQLFIWFLIISLVSSGPSALLNSSDSMSPFSMVEALTTASFGLLAFFLGPFFLYFPWGIAAGHFTSLGQGLSWNISSPSVRKNYWWLVLISIVVTLVEIAGAILCGIGMFVSLPVAMLLQGLCYAYLAREDAALARQTPPAAAM